MKRRDESKISKFITTSGFVHHFMYSADSGVARYRSKSCSRGLLCNLISALERRFYYVIMAKL